MSTVITKTKKESTQILSNKFPKGVKIFDVYASESKETYPDISFLTDKVQKVYVLGRMNFYPNFMIAPKNENIAIRVKFGGKETRPVLVVENDSLIAIGLIHKNQLELYGEKFFKQLLGHFNQCVDKAHVTCFVNKFNKWTMNPFIGDMFKASNSIESYRNQYVTTKTAWISAF